MIEDQEALALMKEADNFAIHFFEEIEAKNKYLSKTLSSITKSSEIGINYKNCMDALNTKLNNLNPRNIDFNKKSLFGNPYKRYFKKVKNEEAQISFLATILVDQQEILKRDNITLNIEVSKLTAMISDLYTVSAQGQELEKRIEEKLATLKNKPDIDFYNENALLPVRRKLTEIQQMITVKTQNILTLNIIQKNNLVIIQNIDSIKNVTIDALNVLAISAKAKNDQVELLKCYDNAELKLNEANIVVQETLPENKAKFGELNNQ